MNAIQFLSPAIRNLSPAEGSLEGLTLPGEADFLNALQALVGGETEPGQKDAAAIDNQNQDDNLSEIDLALVQMLTAQPMLYQAAASEQPAVKPVASPVPAAQQKVFAGSAAAAAIARLPVMAESAAQANHTESIDPAVDRALLPQQAAIVAGALNQPTAAGTRQTGAADKDMAPGRITGLNQQTAAADQIQLPPEQTILMAAPSGETSSQTSAESFLASFMHAQASSAEADPASDARPAEPFALDTGMPGQNLAASVDSLSSAAVRLSVAARQTAEPAGASLISQVAESIELSWQGSQQVLRIRLKPDSFGEVQIRLTKGREGLTARIHTDNAETHRMLSAQIGTLQDSLQDKGLNCRQIDIQYTGGDSGWNSNSGSARFQQQDNGRPDQTLSRTGDAAPASPESEPTATSPVERNTTGKINRLA